MKMNPSQFFVAWRIVIVFLAVHHKNGNCMATCPTIDQTARRVQRCPMNEAEWESAAMHKKCGELHRNCTSPTHFKYHCALNVFLNESWEVCAPGKYLLGHCIEYNEVGNRIQDDYRRNCSAMNPPCPSRYKSIEAYKYQGCYQTGKQSTDIYSTSMPSTTKETKKETDNGNIIWIAVLSSCTGVSVVIFISVIICMGKRRRSRQKLKMKEVELRPLNGTNNRQVLTI